MKTAVELFETFLKNDQHARFAYHVHLVEELIEERDDVKEQLAFNHIRHAELPEGASQEDIDELQQEMVALDAQLDRMNRVLSFVNGATKGSLITQVVDTLEWEYQEPVYYTDQDDIANLAFNFFNAHAIITNQH